MVGIGTHVSEAGKELSGSEVLDSIGKKTAWVWNQETNLMGVKRDIVPITGRMMGNLDISTTSNQFQNVSPD